MSWTPDAWDAFCGLVEAAWPGEFTDEAARSWRVLLDDVEPEQAIVGLKRLLHRGGTFRPSVAELLRAIHEDPSLPTFEEAWALIRRAMDTPLPAGTYSDLGAMNRAEREAFTNALRAHHPSVLAFVQRQGVTRIRELRTDDPEHGELRRKELRDAWDRHVQAGDTRRVAALAAGDRDGLRQLDPLASLDLPNVPQIEEVHP